MSMRSEPRTSIICKPTLTADTHKRSTVHERVPFTGYFLPSLLADEPRVGQTRLELLLPCVERRSINFFKDV